MDKPLDSNSSINVTRGFGETHSELQQNIAAGEVDTSAPFESVKEAVTRFGGVGFWKPHASQSVDAADNEEQLAKDLIVKERETLEILKELEATKTTIERLKLKLHEKEESARNKELPKEGDDENALDSNHNTSLILTELNQAKLNLTRTTNDLADIRAALETYNKKIDKERFELENTRQRINSLLEKSSKTSSLSSLEQVVDLPRELHRLTSETEQFKKIGEVAKSEVVRATNQIYNTKRKIKTAEVRLIAARKLKEAARASEKVARSELKALSKSLTLGLTEDREEEEEETVCVSFEEYSCLKRKGREADEALTTRVNEAMVQVDEAKLLKTEILNRVEEATEEVKSSKRVLEEALSKVEEANNEKLKAEEDLRKWRCGQRRKSTVQNSTKFKNSSSRVINNTRLFDVNGAHLGGGNNGNVSSGPVLRPTMSIGQILNRKLLLTEEYSEKSSVKRKVSLAQMLSKASSDVGGNGLGVGGGKRRQGKRRRFGFGQISFLVAKPSNKKKKHGIDKS